jgi:hypothetical protein
MATLAEIKAKYGKIHAELTTEFYPLKRAGLVDSELQAIFDTSHEQNERAKQAEIKKASDYVEKPPPRNLEAEIDELRAEIKALKGR